VPPVCIFSTLEPPVRGSFREKWFTTDVNVYKLNLSNLDRIEKYIIEIGRIHLIVNRFATRSLSIFDTSMSMSHFNSKIEIHRDIHVVFYSFSFILFLPSLLSQPMLELEAEPAIGGKFLRRRCGEGSRN